MTGALSHKFGEKFVVFCAKKIRLVFNSGESFSKCSLL